MSIGSGTGLERADAARYFAFVESSDAFDDRDAGEPSPRYPRGWNTLLEHRRRMDLATPVRVIWLDCVRADDFLALPWLAEPCERGNPVHSARRRKRLQSIDPALLVVVLVFLDASRRDDFSDAAWHRIRIDGSGDTPVVVAGDFEAAVDADAASLSLMRHEGPCGDAERRLLLQAFSLDFLPDADFDERGRTPPLPLPLQPLQPQAVRRPVARSRDTIAIATRTLRDRDEDADGAAGLLEAGE